MARKKVSAAELLEMQNKGAKITQAEKEVFGGLQAIVGEMKSLVETNRSILEENRALTDMIIGKLTEVASSKSAVSVDLNPIRDLVEGMAIPAESGNNEYQFEVQRNARGLMTGMTATVKKPTIQ